MIQYATLGIPKGMKNEISITFYLEILVKNENITCGMQNEKPFEIILHVGRVTILQSWKGSQK